MPWIGWVPAEEATGLLADLYRRYGSPHGLDHILKVHSLNPESLERHYRFYDHLMRGPSALSRSEREMIGVVVSAANDCFY